MAIKNIIYDFGGVLYEINYHKSFGEFLKIARDPDALFDRGLQEFSHHKTFLDYETGLISDEVFAQNLIKEFNLFDDFEAVKKAYNALLVDYFPSVYEIVKAQKENYSISLLSNTNKMHFEHYFAQKPQLFDLFEHKFLSFELKVCKPNIEIFQQALAISGYNPEETLFADDLQENLDGAEKAGFKTFLVDKNNNIRRLSKMIKNGQV